MMTLLVFSAALFIFVIWAVYKVAALADKRDVRNYMMITVDDDENEEESEEN